MDVRFPIGKPVIPEEMTKEAIDSFVKELEMFPAKLNEALENLPEKSLEATYREGGWTVRQLVHHLADAHMNGFVRFKWALTEESPAVKTFDINKWADTYEAQGSPIEGSLMLLSGLHAKWVYLLRSLTLEDFEKTFYHPDRDKTMTLFTWLCNYTWHGNHHLQHIKIALQNT
ncbi:YfiT family bacillithiol transferase [Metabacillus arenae]|uniref:Metal-dependent hydrolase n=1 Tax=Metabacillus arenae TaxID=2771434 RepID=A0A926NKZ7_9BACI|nr:putative metal-dependent hydrolase [Metabacillus arenae]MBD1381893.1 putative metal-dependent hydrolase [Metabacillus arenae]